MLEILLYFFAFSLLGVIGLIAFSYMVIKAMVKLEKETNALLPNKKIDNIIHVNFK